MLQKLPKEEKYNTSSHALGFIIALLIFPFLWVKTYYNGDSIHFGASIIYGLSFIFLYISSTCYHYQLNHKKKFLWRKIDHISIYLMISGSYVPFMIKYIPLTKAMIFLSIMYSMVFVGSVLKLWFTGKFEKASLVLYIFLGWMVVFIGKTFFTTAPYIVSTMVVFGGVAYMIGVYFYSNDEKRYYHSIWHIFVLLGSLFHFAGIYLAV